MGRKRFPLFQEEKKTPRCGVKNDFLFSIDEKRKRKKEENKKEKESPEYYPFVEMSYIGADKIEFPMKKIRLLKGYDLEFNLVMELYTDKMFIKAETIIIDGEKYALP